ncbi:hypothetical protein HY58_18485 [Flavihumibacter sp. ZG627]|nr:hypothetical protein HY58_18485 [Flavihumibacter sp. ZG627]
MSDDFGDTPGARYKRDGKFSGEEFLEKLLEPKFIKAMNENYILLIDLDRVWGYPSSFVSGSFGKLSISYGSDKVLKHIKFKSDENPIRLERIIHEIKQPIKK